MIFVFTRTYVMIATIAFVLPHIQFGQLRLKLMVLEIAYEDGIFESNQHMIIPFFFRSCIINQRLVNLTYNVPRTLCCAIIAQLYRYRNWKHQ